MRKFYLLLLFCIVLFKAIGQPGSLDSTFGNNGIQTTAFISNANTLWEEGSVVLTMPDGDIFVVVNINISYTGIVKYLPDGRLDSSYGNAGYSNVVNLGVTCATLQGDKIVVGGRSGDYPNFKYALVRYTADGKLDASFGENGKVTTDIGVNLITLQVDKIIVGGSALARYTADGTLDTSFGVNGKVTTDFGAASIALQGDKIIVAGYAYTGFSYDFAVARYTTDGVLDSYFGDNGKVTTDFNNSDDEATSMALQGDKIIVIGYNGEWPDYDFILAGYTVDGRLDDSFGKNGLLTGNFPSTQTYFTSIAIQGNKVIATGHTLNNDNNPDFTLARYTAVGTLDSSFGKYGKVTTDFSNTSDIASSIVLQEDKIIVGGSCNSDFALARYTKDGILDSTFGVNGKVTIDFTNSYDHANSIVLQRDKIIVAGSTFDYTKFDYDFALARFTADGTLDSSFGEYGKVTTDFSYSTNLATSMVIQGDKIIVAGYTNDPFNSNDFALARYTADGMLDSSFGVNGIVTTDYRRDNNYATCIVLQGVKIIVGGYSSGNFALVRYTKNGMLDSSFGEYGIVITGINSNDRANSIALQGDKIIMAGYSELPDFSTNLSLARYTKDGVLDASFGEHGIVITDLEGSAFLQDIALYENRLYAVGSLTTGTDESYGVVAAYQLESPEPTVSIADVTVPESKKFAVVTVNLSAPANRWVRVHYTTRSKTGTSPQDYLPVKGTLLFIPGVNTTAKVIIPIIDDNQHEEDEQFEILLTIIRNASFQDSVAVVTILDDDGALITKQENTSLRIHATPNPTTGAFTIQLQSSSLKQQVSIRVYGVSGRLIEQRENISIGQSLRLGDQYKPGTYLIEALQGSRSVQTKVIKTSQ